tara:strand:- start:213 stop:980 length:768 start_codon:yes stop_codon:yes gene_type:complete
MSMGIYEGMELEFTHLPTGKTVKFLAYLENLADMYSSTWKAEDVYGRMDPIVNFINTRRAFSVSWNIPANSFADAKENLRKVNTLMSFLYPLYAKGSGGATAINQAPLMRVKFGNLIQNINGIGLLGYLNGFTMDPRVENGMFYSTVGSPEYYPKTILLNTELNVLHEHELGYKKFDETTNKYVFRDKRIKEDKNLSTNFPYKVSKTTAADAPEAIRSLQVKGPDGIVRNNTFISADPESVFAVMGNGSFPGEEK